jgi:large conductance mechanosensitive channel
VWKDFKAFAFGGNLVDLAIGFIIGAAFAGLVESLATNVIMDVVAAVTGQGSTESLTFGLNGGEVHYGRFLASLVSFVILAGILFLIVTAIKRAGLGNFRAQGQRECPFCKEFIAVDAIRCRHCTSAVEAEAPDPEDAGLQIT